jgi:16S rRNA (cytosine967-C5)-methyltransferase
MAIANVELVGMDATRPLPWLSKFDRLLVDVPCSGTGTLSRNPEIRWKLRPEDLREAHRLQAAMLSHALDVASDHARLVYSTCSLEPEENENVVAEVFEQNPAWRLVSGEDALGPHLRDPAAANRFFADEGFFRTFPPEHGTDGFFAAVLERQKS